MFKLTTLALKLSENTTLQKYTASADRYISAGGAVVDTIKHFLNEAWKLALHYRFIVFGLAIILLICLIILWAQKHMPSRGRILDIYDENGELRSKKKEKSSKKSTKIKVEDMKELPKDFYKRK